MLSDERSPPMGTGKGILQLALILLFAAILAGCASSNKAAGMSGIDQTIPGATKWGHYDGEPVTKWNPDGRTMTLLTELRYTDPDRKSTRLNSSHVKISYAVFCLKKKKKK